MMKFKEFIHYDKVMYVRDKCMYLRHLFKYPYMTFKEVKIIKEVLNRYSSKRIEVFEYGSGYSTLYFPRYLRKNSYDFLWTAVENSQEWYHRIHGQIRDFRINLNLIKGVNEYINFPSQEYDVIIVDSPRDWRKECLLKARRHLKKGGCAILHDAQHIHYHSCFEVYGSQEIIDTGRLAFKQRPLQKLWIGYE